MEGEEDYRNFRAAVLKGNVLGRLGKDELDELVQAYYDVDGPDPKAGAPAQSEYRKKLAKLRRQYKTESAKYIQEQEDSPSVSVEEVKTLLSEVDKMEEENNKAKELAMDTAVEKAMEAVPEPAKDEGSAPAQDEIDDDGPVIVINCPHPIRSFEEGVQKGYMLAAMFGISAVVWLYFVALIFKLVV